LSDTEDAGLARNNADVSVSSSRDEVVVGTSTALRLQRGYGSLQGTVRHISSLSNRLWVPDTVYPEHIRDILLLLQPMVFAHGFSETDSDEETEEYLLDLTPLLLSKACLHGHSLCLQS